jgi:O-methyltransferase involved in polyketide biosynthesis
MQGEGYARQTFFDAVVDRNTRDIEQLVILGAGFDPSKPALFLWEGMIGYLGMDADKERLCWIASCAESSVVAFDHYTSEPLKSKMPLWR